MNRATDQIRAVFFDRDGTLCYRSPERDHEFQQWVRERSRFQTIPFTQSQATVWQEFFVSHRSDMVTDVFSEAQFWIEFWQRSLDLLGVDPVYLDEALDKFVFFKFSEIYAETRPVLTALFERGYLLGVISDTFPSLGDSLSHLRLDHFFSTVIDSTSVGVMKPAPQIYERALWALDVLAAQSLFVDDVYEHVKGAREVGMQGLWLNRTQAEHNLDEGIVADLQGVLLYLGIS